MHVSYDENCGGTSGTDRTFDKMLVRTKEDAVSVSAPTQMYDEKEICGGLNVCGAFVVSCFHCTRNILIPGM